jgi:hypothetical protein
MLLGLIPAMCHTTESLQLGVYVFFARNELLAVERGEKNVDRDV